MTEQTQLLYPVVMMLAVAVGALVSRRSQRGLKLTGTHRLWIGLWAFSGAMLLAKLPFVIVASLHADAGRSVLLSGKTIMLGLAGGYAGVEFAKWQLGIRSKTGDSFAVPVALSIGIGRLACLCGGCCYGTPTTLPWGLTFITADALPRHPTQIYEAIFHFVAAFALTVLRSEGMLRGQLIKLYFLAYFSYRFLTEYIRPEPVVYGGLTAYQWGAVLLIPLFIVLWLWDNQTLRQPENVASLAESGTSD